MNMTLSEYPRPQMRRDNYTILNGLWQYAITGSAAEPDTYQGKILVPFSPEAPMSGVSRTLKPGEYLHYRLVLPVGETAEEADAKTAVAKPAPQNAASENTVLRNAVSEKAMPLNTASENAASESAEASLAENLRLRKRLLLHFGAVDEHCRIYVNGKFAGEHRGGYLSFTVDITEFLRETENVLHVVVRDDTDTSFHARGKQKLSPGGMFYSAQSGIWQTVWMEWVPENYISGLRITPHLKDEILELTVFDTPADGRRSRFGSHNRADAFARIYEVLPEGRREIHRFYLHTGDRVYVRIPNPHTWTPEDPYLYIITVEMGEDLVESYFAMRSFSAEKDARGIMRFCLNGQPYFANGVLDQGYWEEGLMTPPSDQAMIDDIAGVKALGFNMLRKHVKIEPARWYYHCDRLGMLVWQDAVNGGGEYDMNFLCNMPNILSPTQTMIRDDKYERFARQDPEGRQEYLRELTQMVEQLYNVVSICTWVPFNEGWGQFDALKVEKIVRSLDKTRLIDHASGWFDQGGGDYRSVHNYFRPLSVHAGRRIYALTEFGGYSRIIEGRSERNGMSAYRTFNSEKEITDAYSRLIRRSILPGIAKGLSVTVYTQLSDIEEEVNGLFTYDREIVKINRNVLRRLNKLVYETFEEAVE